MSTVEEPAPARRRPWLPLMVLAAGAAVIAWMLLRYRPAPVVPRDADHAQAAVPRGCLHCHGKGRPNQRPPDHPIGEACFSCHRRE